MQYNCARSIQRGKYRLWRFWSDSHALSGAKTIDRDGDGNKSFNILTHLPVLKWLPIARVHRPNRSWHGKKVHCYAEVIFYRKVALTAKL